MECVKAELCKGTGLIFSKIGTILVKKSHFLSDMSVVIHRYCKAFLCTLDQIGLVFDDFEMISLKIPKFRQRLAYLGKCSYCEKIHFLDHG